MSEVMGLDDDGGAVFGVVMFGDDDGVMVMLKNGGG